MSESEGVLFRSAQVRGRSRPVDVLVRAGRVAAVAGVLAADGAAVIDCDGGALLPGLHDHHCHLLATAAARTSVDCGPPAVRRPADLRAALERAEPVAGWVRGVGYDESVAGDLDRTALDALRVDVPVRVQHRSGALWIVNSCGADLLDLDGAVVDGIERDPSGRATGRLWRLDGWLRERLGRDNAPDLAALSDELVALGVTGVTDATPELDDTAAATLSELRQHVLLLGAGGPGPYKIVVADHDLPTYPDLVATLRAVRPRPVAVHSVTRASLLLTLAALADVGAVDGDRIEHAAVTPPEAAATMATLGVTVVTQPSFVALRGDEYLDRMDSADLPWLWPFRSLLDARVPVACSSDAPYGSLDPWASIAAASRRRAPSGRQVAARQAVDASVALDGYLSHPLAPGGPARVVEVGAPADLVLLDRPLESMLAEPDARAVRLTLIDGQ